MRSVAEGTSRRWFLLSAVLLAAHEVDSGGWREWELLGLPGGPQLFVVLHLGIFLLLFWGYGEAIRGSRAGHWMSWVVAGAALFAASLHGLLLALGHPRFTTPVSIALLAGLGISGAAQLAASLGSTRAQARPATGRP